MDRNRSLSLSIPIGFDELSGSETDDTESTDETTHMLSLR